VGKTFAPAKPATPTEDTVTTSFAPSPLADPSHQLEVRRSRATQLAEARRSEADAAAVDVSDLLDPHDPVSGTNPTGSVR
jgi:hypothetical protein